MSKTLVSFLLSATVLWSSLASANGGMPLFNRLAIEAARGFKVTETGVTVMSRSFWTRQVLSNSKLHATGVRQMKLVNHGGADYLVMLNGQNQVMRAVHFSPSSPQALAKFKPSVLRQTLTLTGAAKVGHIIKDKAMHFPIEAAAFAIAIGAITLYQIQHDLPKNPMAMRQFVDGQWDGHSQFSFYLFMVAAGIATAPFEEALRQGNRKFLGHFVNYFSMSVGMLVSHMYNDLMKGQGMRNCSWAMLTADIKNVPTICDAAWEEYKQTWRDPDQRAQRFNELSISGINLLASAGLAAVTAWTVEKVLVAVGINLSLFALPGGWVARAPRIASWTMRGLKSTVSAFNFMAWTTYLEEPTTSLYENALHTGPELNELSHCMGVQFEGLATQDRRRLHALRRELSHRCYGSLPQFYDKFLKTSVRWRNENMTPVINSQKNWEMHLVELSTYYRTSERFYQNLTEAVDAKRNMKDGAPSPLDAKMYYFGVIPQTYSDDLTPVKVAALQRARVDALRRANPDETEEMHLQSDQTLPPLHRTPVVPPAVDTTNEQNKPEFSWGIYLLEDFKGLEADQDKHVKYVARAMYRTYLKLTKDKRNSARPLTDQELRATKRLMDFMSYQELTGGPLSRLKLLAPVPPKELKFSDAEMLSLRELIKKLASDKREVVGEGLLELYQSISPELTGNSVKVKDRKFYGEMYTAFLNEVYKALGQPLPMKDAGRGYMSAWTLFQDESAKKLDDKRPETPFSKVSHQTMTLTAPEYLSTAMIWGPDLSKGEELVAVNRNGFKSEFRPPKLVPSGQVYVWNRTHIQEGTNDQHETIFTRLIWLDSDKTPGCSAEKKFCYKPILDWIREGHFRADVMTPTENKLASWWVQKVKPPYLDAWADFERKYESVIKQFLGTLYGEDRYFQLPIPFVDLKAGRYQSNEQHMLNPSEFKNGVLSALNQERQIALFFLSQILDGQYQAQINLPNQKPREMTLMQTIAANPTISPVLQNYENYWQRSVGMFLNLRIPLELMQSEYQTENKFIPRLDNQTLVERYKALNDMVDELEKRLELRASMRDDDNGDFSKTPMYAVAVSALKSLRNSHEEMLDYGTIINAVSYVEQHEDRNNPVLRRCLKTSKTGGAVPFGGNANSATKPANCP